MCGVLWVLLQVEEGAATAAPAAPDDLFGSESE
jgi:hypothetical protein